MQSIYLIRHAKATGQEPHAELTDEGIRQAEKLADILAHHSITYIVSSPWKRAVQTAMPLGIATLQHIHTDERLQERILSSLDLSNWMDVLKRTYDDVDWVEEGGESSRNAAARGWHYWKSCGADRNSTRPWLHMETCYHCLFVSMNHPLVMKSGANCLTRMCMCWRDNDRMQGCPPFEECGQIKQQKSAPAILYQPEHSFVYPRGKFTMRQS